MHFSGWRSFDSFSALIGDVSIVTNPWRVIKMVYVRRIYFHTALIDLLGLNLQLFSWVIKNAGWCWEERLSPSRQASGQRLITRTYILAVIIVTRAFSDCWHQLKWRLGLGPFRRMKETQDSSVSPIFLDEACRADKGDPSLMGAMFRLRVSPNQWQWCAQWYCFFRGSFYLVFRKWPRGHFSSPALWAYYDVPSLPEPSVDVNQSKGNANVCAIRPLKVCCRRNGVSWLGVTNPHLLPLTPSNLWEWEEFEITVWIPNEGCTDVKVMWAATGGCYEMHVGCAPKKAPWRFHQPSPLEAIFCAFVTFGARTFNRRG